MGRLVQPPPPSGTHREYPACRGRTTILRHAGRTSYGRITQTKRSPVKPGRFIPPQETCLFPLVTIQMRDVFEGAVFSLSTASGLAEQKPLTSLPRGYVNGQQFPPFSDWKHKTNPRRAGSLSPLHRLTLQRNIEHRSWGRSPSPLCIATDTSLLAGRFSAE